MGHLKDQIATTVTHNFKKNINLYKYHWHIWDIFSKIKQEDPWNWSSFLGGELKEKNSLINLLIRTHVTFSETSVHKKKYVDVTTET